MTVVIALLTLIGIIGVGGGVVQELRDQQNRPEARIMFLVGALALAIVVASFYFKVGN